MTVTATSELLLERASRQSGLTDFGPDGWQAGFERLVEAVGSDVGEDAGAGAVVALETLIVNRLVKRLRVEEWYAGHATEAAHQVEGPVVILGMPRTGTTALHYLLALDPQFRYPRKWELNDPVPPPDVATESEDPRRPSQPPEISVQHIASADGPTEDRYIHELCFNDREGVLPVPAFTRWWDTADHGAAFGYHERILRLLHSRRPPYYWLVKDPLYLFQITDLAARYPNARFVMTHRDPVAVIPSTCSTMIAARRKRLPGWITDRVELGQEVMRTFTDGLRRAAAARAALGDHRFLDVGQRELASDAVTAAERIYEFAGLRLDGTVRTAMARWGIDNKPGSRGEHHYSAEEFGLTAESIRQSFAPYLDMFGDYCMEP
jgi:hypothetical protein